MLDKHLIASTSPHADISNIVLYKDFRITVLTDRLFRIEKAADKSFCDEATQAIWFRDTPPVDFTTQAVSDKLIIKTAKAELYCTDEICDFRIVLDDGEHDITNTGNLLGTYRTLDCCDADIYINSEKNIKAPIQLGFGIASRSGVAVYDDSASLILTEDGTLNSRSPETDLYVFGYGKDYRGALQALYRICGKAPLIPRFALGNWWSRYHAYTDHEYLQTMDRLSKRRIPLTVATVDMDWHWSETVDEHFHITESGKNDEYHGFPARGWTGYSWNTDLFPDYKAFLTELHKRGLHVTLNLHPARGVRYFEDRYKEMAEACGYDPESERCVAFDFTSDDFINAYFRILHKPYEHDGVDFWWIDWQQGTKTALAGLDPLWALNHYHTLDSAKEHMPLILSRYAGIGSHRYPLGFSGDTFVTWETLAYLPYFTANATNAGYTWWSHDIGGHMAGIKDDELYVRFVQFGVFSPINRLHCTDSVLSTKEPSVYMNGMGLIAEEFLRLRHRLIPYLYSASYENTCFGLALIEPLYYRYPDIDEAYEYRTEYFFGPSLLVSPITKKSDMSGLSSAQVYLPEGHWTDIFTGDEYDGGRSVLCFRWADTIPVFASSGSFVVLDGREYTNNPDEPDELEVRAYSGTGSYTLHEDDKCTVFSSKLTDNEFTVDIKSHGARDRRIDLYFPNVYKGRAKVFADGQEHEVAADESCCVSFMLKCDDRASVIVQLTTESRKEKRNRMLIYSMLRINGDHIKRSKLLKQLTEADDDECKKLITDCDFLKSSEKQRLLEAFYI